MSLTTSCPACGTMFRVVPDQLKISEGWVRCGHCSEVFDATAHMADEAPSRPQLPPEPPQQPQQPPQPLQPLQPPPPQQQPPQLAAAGVAAEPDNESLEPSALDAPFVFRRSDLTGEGEFVPSVLPPPARPAESRPPAGRREPDSELADVSFVRQARRKALWRRPLVRLGLTFVSLLLAAGLLLQLAWRDRDRLATLQPELRPALQEMCHHLQCSLGPPRQIEALLIESSGFNRVRNDVYRLSFGLRNTAPTAVAAPAMELTLTDAQDQPLMRKVLSPAELGARDDVIAGGAEWSGTVGIVVAGNTGPRVAGYRLLAFYP